MLTYVCVRVVSVLNICVHFDLCMCVCVRASFCNVVCVCVLNFLILYVRFMCICVFCIISV